MSINTVKEGEKYQTKFNGEFIVIKRYRNDKVLIKFADEFGFETITRESHIREGNIKNPYYPRVFGVGYTGVGIYSHKTHEHIYKMWNRMLERCYSKTSQTNKPTYIGCNVCKEWHCLQDFAKWFVEQEDCEKGYELDKDLLVKGNKLYSPETCVLLPRKVNLMLTAAASNNKLGIVGVIERCGKYSASVYIDGKIKCLGTYDTSKEASLAYAKEKEAYVRKVALSIKSEISQRAFDALMSWVVY